MACEGCKKRREWLTQKFDQLVGRGSVKKSIILGVPVTLSTEGETTTAWLGMTGELLGRVQDPSDEKRHMMIVAMVRLHKANNPE